MTNYSVRIFSDGVVATVDIQAETPSTAKALARAAAEQWLETGNWDTSHGTLYLGASWSLYQRKFAVLDADGELIGVYDSRDGAAGACQDAAREADSAGDGYEVEQRDDEIASGSVAVTVHPDEPDCSEPDGHDWQRPHDIVGGIEENPGVWGHGGGVIITDVCMHCGCGRHTDTWAQDPNTGEQGLESISYEPGEFADQIAETEETETW